MAAWVLREVRLPSCRLPPWWMGPTTTAAAPAPAPAAVCLSRRPCCWPAWPAWVVASVAGGVPGRVPASSEQERGAGTGTIDPDRRYCLQCTLDALRPGFEHTRCAGLEGLRAAPANVL